MYSFLMVLGAGEIQNDHSVLSEAWMGLQTVQGTGKVLPTSPAVGLSSDFGLWL